MGWTTILQNHVLFTAISVAILIGAEPTSSVATTEPRDFIGIGYNILTSNFDYEDTGLLQYNKHIMAPNSSQISTIGIADDCAADITSLHAFEGTESYQSKILKSVHLSEATKTLLGGFEFSKSKSYHFIADSIANNHVLYQIRIFCNAKEATLISTDGVPLADEYISNVLQLPTSYVQRDYMDFINKWGTDVVTQIQLGLKTHHMNQTSQVKVVQQGVKMKQYTLSGPDKVRAPMDIIRQNLTQSPEIFADFTETVTIGSTDRPALVGLTLISITDTFDEKFWKGFDHDATALAARRMNLFIALSEYPVWMSAIKGFNPVVEADVTWPMGIYSLPMVDSNEGCPINAFDWKTGSRYQDTEDIFPNNGWSKPYHLKGPYSNTYVETNFCSKMIAREDTNDWEWMPGEYCIYRKEGVCPSGLNSGHVLWDDENIFNNNDQSGILPDGIYDDTTKIYFCCREDGPVDEPLLLPTADPFILIQKNTKCQQVHGMSISEEWFHYDGDEGLGFNKEYFGGSHPYNSGRDNDHVLHYCYYF